MEPISTIALAALILASKSGAEELGKDAGQSAWAGLARLRALVQRKFHGDGRAMSALAQAEQHPRDDAAVTRLEQALASYAAQDEQFAAELRGLIDEARQRPEYRPGSQLFANYGWVGEMTVFNAPVHLEHGDINIS